MNPFHLLLIGANISSDQKLNPALTEGGKVECRGVASLQGWEAGGGPIDLVVLEIDQLPPAIHWLRAFKRSYPDIPVICLIQESNTSAASLCFDAGATDVFRQPIHHSLLCDRIRALLQPGKYD